MLKELKQPSLPFEIQMVISLHCGKSEKLNSKPVLQQLISGYLTVQLDLIRFLLPK